MKNLMKLNKLKLKKIKGDASIRIFYRKEKNNKKSIIVYANREKTKNLLEYDAVNKSGGTAYNAKLNPSIAKVYGKTGTVQICSNCDIPPHAWFGGFVEFENNRKYSVSVLIENGGKGSNIPAKIAKKIFEFIFNNDI